MRLLIAMPCYQHIEPDCFKSVYGLQRVPDWDYLLEIYRGYGVQHARTLAMADAINGGFDKLLFVDSDIILPSDTVPRLMALESAIATGWYIRKQSTTGETELFFFDNGANHFVNINSSEFTGGSKTIAGCGMGCCLIDIPAITPHYGRSWLEYIIYPDGERLSEDNNFCWHATHNGLAVKADTDLKCGHISRTIL